MAGATDKVRFYMEQAVPQLREFEEKKIFTKVCSSKHQTPTTPPPPLPHSLKESSNHLYRKRKPRLTLPPPPPGRNPRPRQKALRLRAPPPRPLLPRTHLRALRSLGNEPRAPPLNPLRPPAHQVLLLAHRAGAHLRHLRARHAQAPRRPGAVDDVPGVCADGARDEQVQDCVDGGAEAALYGAGLVGVCGEAGAGGERYGGGEELFAAWDEVL